MLSEHDEREVSWYFLHGVPAFERSAASGAFERGALFSFDNAQQYAREHGYSIFPQDEVTARPSSAPEHALRSEPDGELLTRYAVVSRRLVLLEHRVLLGPTVLQAYYGDLGAQWALSAKPGRIAALYHLTAAGVRLLELSADERARKGQPELVLAPHVLMQNEINAPSGSQKDRAERRRQGLDRALTQATQLLREVCGHWREVVSEQSAAREVRPA